jgi:large subunit ribosomal protein L17
MRKFHRKRGPRRAFLKGLAGHLIMKGKITTTLARAKEIRSMVERMVTIAKKQRLSALRLLLSRLSKRAAQKVFYDIASRYKDRQGGYLRITKQTRMRKRDGAPLAIIEFV